MMLEIAYVGNRGLKLPAFRNLNQQPVVFDAAGAPGARRASSGGTGHQRRRTTAGEPRRLQLSLAAGEIRKAVFGRGLRTGVLYLGQGAHKRRRSPLDVGRRKRHRRRSIQGASKRVRPPGRIRAIRVRRATSNHRIGRLAVAVRKTGPLRTAVRRLGVFSDCLPPEWPGTDYRAIEPADPRRRAAKPSEPHCERQRYRSRSAPWTAISTPPHSA